MTLTKEIHKSKIVTKSIPACIPIKSDYNVTVSSSNSQDASYPAVLSH